jgi:uncharacterized surface protein with fasciclin (FAS1) repeats
MKYSVFLPLAASAATAFVLPDAVLTENIVLSENTIGKEPTHDSEASSWWDAIPSKADVFSTLDSTVKSSIDSALDSITSARDAAIGSLNTVIDSVLDEENSFFNEWHDNDEEEEADFDLEDNDRPHRRPGHGHHGKHGKHGHHGHYGNASKTIYELISESKYTTKFAKIIEDYPDIVDVLKSTKANHTLFVPTDKAIERIPDHHKDKDKKPSKEFIEAVLKYHVVPGLFPARRLAFRHTVPTLLELSTLGDHPQRLRVSASLLGGLRLNFFVKVIAADVVAKNGFIHAVDHIILPPPKVGRILKLFPQYFSTLLLGFEQSGLGKELPDVEKYAVGGTFFAPTNRAFAKLGPAANAFLFSKKGEKYLNAILKYHIVANETFYSDAFYSGKSKDDSAAADAGGRYHLDLPSLLGQPISVDVRRFFKFISIRVNGWTGVDVQDVVAYDGVIQVIDSVLLPAHKHHGQTEAVEEDISVEDLVERLDPFMGRTKESEQVWVDL